MTRMSMAREGSGLLLWLLLAFAAAAVAVWPRCRRALSTRS